MTAGTPAGTADDAATTGRDLPRLHYTGADAGARHFPGSRSRSFTYFEPEGGGRASQYEDTTVEVQPDPRHYLAQGWLHSFADGAGGFPLEWTALKARGQETNLPPPRGLGSGGAGHTWPATGWHEFRDPNAEWEQSFYRNAADVVRLTGRTIEIAEHHRAFDSWEPGWLRFVERHLGAWMHVEHGLGLYVFVTAQRRAPTNMHNNAISVGAVHKMRFSQDLALYNLTLTQAAPGFDGDAHLEAWDSDEWAAVRDTVEDLTAIEDWAEAVFVTNAVFEPLVGELFRTHLVVAGAPTGGDFVSPAVVGTGQQDYAERDLRTTTAMFRPLAQDPEYADHNRAQFAGWLAEWVPRCRRAARSLLPLFDVLDDGAGRGQEAIEATERRCAQVCADLGLVPAQENGARRR